MGLSGLRQDTPLTRPAEDRLGHPIRQDYSVSPCFAGRADVGAALSDEQSLLSWAAQPLLDRPTGLSPPRRGGVTGSGTSGRADVCWPDPNPGQSSLAREQAEHF